MKTKKYLAVFLVLLVVQQAKSYDVTTHAMLTYQAYLQSDLSKQPLLQGLGIEYLVPKSSLFSNAYFDSKDGVAIKRKNIASYEDKIINDLRSEKNAPLINYALDLPAWLMRGAIREDDGSYELRRLKWIWTGEKAEPRSGDNPYPLINRYCNHFFDPTKPVGNQAGTFFCPVFGGTIADAPNWALGVNEAFVNTPTITTNRLNHFTLVDAKEAMYRAITGKSPDGAFF